MTTPIAAYVFDLYGTLLDYGALASRFPGLVSDPAAFVATWRAKQLQYAMAASAMERYADFETLTGYAFAYAADVHGFGTTPDAIARARAMWYELPAFPDVARALDAIRSRGVATAVLSNGTLHAITAGLRTANLAEKFDALLSVDSVRAYKPSALAYALATDRFDVAPRQIAFVSSNGWDATGAAEFGFTTVWCNRAGLPAERFGARPDRIVAGLGELLDV